MATIIEAPHLFPSDNLIHSYTIFLAGSIENGTAENWQNKLSNILNNFDHIIVLNPRRKHWDKELDGKKLRTQIVWERNGLRKSDLVIFYFDPTTKSPISLCELGENLAQGKKCIVYCPPTFYRYTNVEVLCSDYGIIPHSDYEVFVANIVSHISRFA